MLSTTVDIYDWIKSFSESFTEEVTEDEAATWMKNIGRCYVTTRKIINGSYKSEVSFLQTQWLSCNSSVEPTGTLVL